ncbi:hypothetical protein TNCV_501201 [Trichonephila clavipes]|nr:hypothetical protein TNCV_501201 [Trichonephila clavipes]
MSSAGYSSSSEHWGRWLPSIAEWAGLVSSHAKPVELPQDWAHSGQSFPWLSKTLRFWGHDSIFVNVRGYDALCSSEGPCNFRLSRLGSLLGFLVGSFIARNPNTNKLGLGLPAARGFEAET